MKAKPGKVPVSSKAQAKTAVAKSKPADKKVAKPVAKGSKPAVKAAAKKAPVKAGAAKKPVSSAASKAAKPVAKPAKPVAKQVAKPVAKPVAKKAVKPVAKSGTTVKPAQSATKPAAKPVAKPATKPTVKQAVKPVTKAEAKPVSKAVLKPVAEPVTKPVAKAPPAKTGRAARFAPSSPSPMAEVVTSSTAKSSYAPIMSSPVIVAPLPSAQKKDPKLANNWKTKPANELTDAELQAMPDSEYMNEKQLGAFRARLLQLKQDILASAGATTEHMREDTVVVPDPADRATIEEEHALELRTRDRERKLLKKIEQSLALIESGDYGYCDETGEPIGVGRLLARPTATLSLEAQQRRELRQRMFGD